MSVVDLRLVPSAIVVWVAAWAATGGAPPESLAAACGWLAGFAGLGLLALHVFCLRRRRGGRRHGERRRHGWGRWASLPGLRGRMRERPGQWGVASLVSHVLLATGCAVAVAASGTAAGAQAATLSALAARGYTVELTGTVGTEPVPFSWGGTPGSASSAPVRYVLDVERVTARSVGSVAGGRVQVVSASTAGLRFGSVITVRGALRPPRPGWTEAATLNADTIVVRQRPTAALRLLDRHRDALMNVTDDLSPQARGLVPGAAIGDTTRLSEELDEAMKTSGLSHITAVSGGHFAIVMALLTGLAGAVGAPRWARVTVLAVAGVAFVALVRPEPAVLRAAVMALFALAGMVLGRPSQAMPALAGTVIGLLVIDPALARSYGFALSAAATAGIVLLAGPLAARFAPWTGKAFGFALAVPLAAQLACGPILVLLDPSVSLVAVPANLLAAPAVVPATILGLAATVSAPWWTWLAHCLAWLAGCATWWIAKVALTAAALPGAAAPWPGGLGGALLLMATTAVALTLVLVIRTRGRPDSWLRGVKFRLHGLVRDARRRPGSGPRLLIGVLAAAVVVGVVTLTVPRMLTGVNTPADWVVAACDVGQGDTTVLRTGPESAVVVDVGPESDAAGDCLDELGVTRIDLLVLSHFHADHVGGLQAALHGRVVAEALVSPIDEPPTAAAVTHSALAAAGVSVRDAQAGDRGAAGTLSWEVVQAGAGSGESAANDGSVVVAARTQGLDVLLLGDLETTGQAALTEALRARPPFGANSEFDVVKVAHHGSAEQSAELARLASPHVALVSAGRHNDYGHPTDQALDLYTGAGAAVVRTDRCGTAVLVLRGGVLGVAGC